MRYLTDAKRAAGLGAAHSGTEHHWRMIVSSVALLGLVPLFVFTFGAGLSLPYEEAAAYYARPFPAIVAGLTLFVGLLHFKSGVRVLIEDYVHGLARKIWIIFTICLSYTLIAVGLFAVARLAL